MIKITSLPVTEKQEKGHEALEGCLESNLTLHVMLMAEMKNRVSVETLLENTKLQNRKFEIAEMGRERKQCFPQSWEISVP